MQEPGGPAERTSFWYLGQEWCPYPTTEDGDSFFHSVFGENEDGQPVFDAFATVRRMRWSAFLTYFENKTRPTCLEQQLQKCDVARGKHLHPLGDHFRDYTEDVVRPEHLVLVEELPVLATLENIRIALFARNSESPEVFEPNPDLIANYPLENTNPLTEAVVWLKGPVFVRLHASKHRIAQPIAEMEIAPKRFKKWPVPMRGMFYQMNLTTLLLLNGFKKFHNWRLSAEVKTAGKFDDVVFEVLPAEGAVLIQVKSSKNKITYSKLFHQRYDFNLATYYYSYQEIKHNYKISNVVVCTDTKLAKELSNLMNRAEISGDSIFYFEGVRSLCYTFNENVIPHLRESLINCERKNEELITEENLQQFLRDFQIIALYPGEGMFNDAIEKTISSLGYCSQFESKDYSKYITKKIIDWYDESEGRYLTQFDAKAYLCGYRSKKFCEKLRSINIDFRADKLTFNNSKRIVHIVPQKEYTLNLVKVYRWLLMKEAKSLFVNPRDKVDIQLQTIQAFETPKYTHLVMYVNTKDEMVIQEMCHEITRILRQDTNKSAILIAERDDMLIKRIANANENLYEQLAESIYFTDLTEETQERLLEEVIMLYEVTL